MPSLLARLRLIARLVRRRPGSVAGATGPDPLDHPLVRRMTARELADLPLPRDAAGC